MWYRVESTPESPLTVRCGWIGEQQLRTLRAFFAPDGVELEVVETQKEHRVKERALED